MQAHEQKVQADYKENSEKLKARIIKMKNREKEICNTLAQRELGLDAREKAVLASEVKMKERERHHAQKLAERELSIVKKLSTRSVVIFSGV